MPLTLLSMNTPGSEMDRSTWLSAARCITRSGSASRTAASTAAASVRSTCWPVPIVCRFAQLAQHLLNRGKVAGIAHLVEIEDVDCRFPQQPAHDGAANEAGTSGDQNSAAISHQVGGGRHGRNHW